MNGLVCLDCGKGVAGEAKVKELAKKFHWTYVAKGKWRCPECQRFQNGMSEQFGEESMGTILVPNKEPY